MAKKRVVFNRGDIVTCIVGKSEWEPVKYDFDRMLSMALGMEVVPEKGKKYTIADPSFLVYSGKVYVELEEIKGKPCAQTGFVKHLDKQDRAEIKRRMELRETLI